MDTITSTDRLISLKTPQVSEIELATPDDHADAIVDGENKDGTGVDPPEPTKAPAWTGSQALDNVIGINNESVNPNTGSLEFTGTLFTLKGVKTSLDLSIGLRYSRASTGTFGLPDNWGLDLPAVTLNDDKSKAENLIYDGRTYIVDPDWKDNLEYQSGLKYCNDHGMKFEKVDPPKALPSDNSKVYQYQMHDNDGTMAYFDAQGRLLEQRDIFDNFLAYSYKEQDPKLDFIQDSWGQRITFTYADGSLQVMIPDGSSSTINFDGSGVGKIKDAINDEINFTYEDDDTNPGKKRLQSISYPSGVRSDFTYTKISYSVQDAADQSLPAIETRKALAADGKLLQNIKYEYGTLRTDPDNKPNTYTGWAIGIKMAPGTDVLMDEINDTTKAYLYDVLETYLDENGKEMSRTQNIFNHLHLSVAEIKFLLVDSGPGIQILKDSSTYDPSSDPHVVNYNRPISTESFHNGNTSGDPSWQPMKRSSTKYNEFGNATDLTEEMFDAAAAQYFSQSTVSSQYKTTKFNTQILTSSIDTDVVSNAVYYTNNTVTADDKSIESTFLKYASGQSPAIPWKERHYEYDTQGRVTVETLAWSQGSNFPAETIDRVTFRMQYSALQDGVLTVTDFDATGNATTTRQAMNKNKGPLLSKKLPDGETELFEYDSIGRLLKHTDAMGKVTTNEYHVGVDDQKASQNWTKTTSPTYYMTVVSYDELGRDILRQDNGGASRDKDPHPDQPNPDLPLRPLATKAYDALSRVVSTTDQYLQTTTHAYDSIGRLVRSSDAQQNIVAYQFDDTKLEIAQTLNDDPRTIEILDGRMRVKSLVKFADSSATSINYNLRELTTYDGEGRIIQKTLNKDYKSAVDGNSVILQSESVKYGPESAVLTRIAEGSSSLDETQRDTITRDYEYDLFGNIYTYTKTTRYVKQDPIAHDGPRNIYDANNRLALAYNQEGGVEKWSYNQNGWLTQSTRLDGSSTGYEYDLNARNTRTTYPSGLKTITSYDDAGKVIQVAEGSAAMSYAYARDGTLLQMTYPDTKSQIYELDGYSRVVKSTDALGQSTSTSYNSFGNVDNITFEQDVVQYAYGTANHMNGKLIGTELKGPRHNKTTLTYDGFDHLQSKTVVDFDTNQILLGTEYTTDATGRLSGYITSSVVYPDKAETRAYSYDGLNQVLSDSVSKGGNPPTVTLYKYDGNSNVVQQEQGSTITTMQYNKIDQRTDEGFKYDANGRMTQDNAGNFYSFDDKDQLINVTTKARLEKKFNYYPNDFLSMYDNNNNKAQMYYAGERINAMNINQNLQSSIFRDTDSIVANYSNSKPDTYFLDCQGSTAVLMQPSLHEVASLDYSAYGAMSTSDKKPTDPQLALQSSFGFQQEFFDQSSGLVYLRARYYNSNLTCFISMDTYREENRYAYCKGDPINLIDAAGRFPSWKKIVSEVVGFVANVVVTGLLELTPLAPIAPVIGGAVGSFVSYGLDAALENKPFTAEGALTAAATGALGGLLFDIPGGKIAASVQSKILAKGGSKLAAKAGKYLLKGAKGFAKYEAGDILNKMAAESVHVAWSIGSNIKHGDPSGVRQAIASGRKSVLSPQALMTMNVSQERTGTQVDAAQQSISVKASIYQPLSFDTSSSSNDNSAFALTMNASFDGSFSTAHDWKPSSMSDIVSRANKGFESQWNDWNAGA